MTSSVLRAITFTLILYFGSSVYFKGYIFAQTTLSPQDNCTTMFANLFNGPDQILLSPGFRINSIESLYIAVINQQLSQEKIIEILIRLDVPFNELQNYLLRQKNFSKEEISMLNANFTRANNTINQIQNRFSEFMPVSSSFDKKEKAKIYSAIAGAKKKFVKNEDIENLLKQLRDGCTSY